MSVTATAPYMVELHWWGGFFDGSTRSPLRSSLAFHSSIQTDHQSKQYAPYKVEHKHVVMEVVITMHLYNSVQCCSRHECGAAYVFLGGSPKHIPPSFLVQLSCCYSLWNKVINIYPIRPMSRRCKVYPHWFEQFLSFVTVSWRRCTSEGTLTLAMIDDLFRNTSSPSLSILHLLVGISQMRLVLLVQMSAWKINAPCYACQSCQVYLTCGWCAQCKKRKKKENK